MIGGRFHSSKEEWRNKVWEIAWSKEDEEYNAFRQNTVMYKIIDKPFFLNCQFVKRP